MTDSSSITVQLTLANVPHADRIPLAVSQSDTCAEFRTNVSKATKIPLEQLRLIVRGRLVGNEAEKKMIDEFKLEDDSVIHCMGKPMVSNPENASSNKASESVTSAAAAGAAVAFSAPTATAREPSSASRDGVIASAGSQTLRQALATLKASNSSETYLTAVTTLQKILSNIASNPMEDKYRKVKKSNAAFNKRLGALIGGSNCMYAVGFVSDQVDGEDAYVMHPSPEAWPQLLAHQQELEQAVQSAKNNVATAVSPNGVLNHPGATTIPGVPSVAGMPQVTPEMQQAAMQMMQDPQQMQTMLQNPMVQNMLRNDARFANNPLMQQSLQQLANNPQMLQQVSQMMQNPDLMNVMAGADGSGRGFGAWPTSHQVGAANNSSASNNQNNQNDQRSDEEMTEEEMLEEAIRRSLNES